MSKFSPLRLLCCSKSKVLLTKSCGEPDDISQWKMDRNKRNLNCFYSIFAKKRNSHGHFVYIKKHKIIPRNCCFGVITLCSPKIFLSISMILNLNCFYSIFTKKSNSHGHFKYIKNIKLYLGIVVLV